MTPTTLPPQELSKPPIATAGIFDQIIDFTGSTRDFSALLLASAFSTGLIQQGVIFTFDPVAGEPAIQGALPPLATGDRPERFQSLLSATWEDGKPSRTMIIPRDKLFGGKQQKPATGLKPLSEKSRTFMAFEMAPGRQNEMPAFRMNLEILGALWRSFEKRAALTPSEQDTGILAPVLAILSVVNSSARFQKSAISFCNELCSRFGCDRVSLGFLSGRSIKLAAMSHTEKLTRGLPLLQAVEQAMEECLDQDVEITYPDTSGNDFVHRAAMELSTKFGSGCIVNVPLRYLKKPIAVVTLERLSPQPPAPHDLKLLRLVADLATPRLAELRQNDRWFGARMATRTREVLAAALGSRHTWAKLAAILCLATIIFFSVFPGQYRVEATFVTQPMEKRVVAAPFDGYLQQAHVRPGDRLTARENVLAELETGELRSSLAMKKAEMRGHERDAAAARRENKLAEAQAAEARMEQCLAECELLKEKIDQARVKTTLSGVVLTGDWSKKAGAPVKQGDTLFEVAPLGNMEADLYVPDEQISDVAVGQCGSLAAAGRPDEKVGFEVVRITPMAELVKQKNVFRVHVRLRNPPEWMLPGLEGVAKIDIEERLLIDIWSRRAVNWVKMKLWAWW
ncbi:MAG: HlyD family efflux transporter periplasmic adaptor subunit [Planctomycetaceae bacterium]|nr:HlyD family efflux transporter periplasmic adaptor subunit [Planctomycetaceae bacterium]